MSCITISDVTHDLALRLVDFVLELEPSAKRLPSPHIGAAGENVFVALQGTDLVYRSPLPEDWLLYYVAPEVRDKSGTNLGH